MEAGYSFNLEQLRCYFTTRALGDLTFARGEREQILANYWQLEKATGIAPEQIVRPRLNNGDLVARVFASDAGKGVLKPPGHLYGVDAVYTNAPNIYIAITTADCYPLILYDRRRLAVGIAHCGWRGIVRHLDEKLLTAMATDFGTHPEDVVAVIGPGIGVCCYRQHDDGLRDAFSDYELPGLTRENNDGTYNIDIALALRANLRAQGIDQIVSTRHCTGCDSKFFSARMEGTDTGRMLNLAAIVT